MSSRAAWQLEAMGFTDAYDYVNGKVEWMVNRQPVEGDGPHYPMAGEVTTKDRLHTCALGSAVSDSSRAVEDSADTYCLVLNDHGVVLGRLRKKHREAASNEVVENVMETGPTTVRPTEPAKPLLERMEQRNVPAVVVTTSKGVLVGVARLNDLRRLVKES
ncbi:MAG: CBS domain-containing protein [Actinomycetota bacterium]|nr:CBS domain-containing protein [Actinomycetota bacterium]